MAARYLFVNDMPRRENYSRQPRRNPLEFFTDEDLIKYFRMTRSEILLVCGLVRNEMECVGSREMDFSLEEKVLICLKTLGSGSFQNTSKDCLNASQPTVSKFLTKFVNAMIKVGSQFIYMPKNAADIVKVKNEFHQIAGFPGVLGCVDGSHIPIIAPSGEDEYAYVNRKKFHSINIQAVCDTNMCFCDIFARCPGSAHDSFVMRQSGLYDRFEAGEFGSGWLLGDSGYALKSWLMTPLANPCTSAEKSYNISHKKTRCLEERAFGILKSRWRILDHTGGSMCYSPEKACKIIYTCCILHNICRRNAAPIIDVSPVAPALDVHNDATDAPTASGVAERERIVRLFS